MNIEFILAEADMAIERNQATLSGNGRYRTDHHADLITVCALLRDELKGLRGRARNESQDSSLREKQAQRDSEGQDYAGLNVGIIRAPYRTRTSRD
jgi:hypothetical protein